MNSIFQDPAHRVTIGGVVTDVLEIHSSHGTRQPIATCDLAMTLPLPAHVANLAPVVVEVSTDGVSYHTDFTGVVRMPEPSSTLAGDVATVHCLGTNYPLAYEVGRDVVYAGGAKTGPTTLLSSPLHIGAATIAWYADTTPVGTSHDLTFNPAADSHFVWITLDLHGTNSYPVSIGDKKIRDWSRIEIWQNSVKLGYANLPVHNEQFGSELDYTDDDNWSQDVKVFIAAQIVDADGDVTVRFVSGTKPGSSQRDDYEINNVTYKTAARQPLRKIVRGLKRLMGITTFDVAEIEDIDDNTILLGGNGLVDAGLVRVGEREQPVAVIPRALDLFGYADFDCPDGTPRTRPIRGVPEASPVATFTEETNAWDPRWSRDPLGVYNAVKVTGASGNNQNGARFAYLYQTADIDVIPNAFIPSGIDRHQLDLSNSWLVSDDLCQQVGEIAEVNRTDPREIEWVTWPHALKPSDVVSVDFPTVSFSGDVFLTGIRTDIDASGYRQTLTGWVGTEHPFGDDPDDPDPDEDDDEPTDPRDPDEWFAYRPNAGVS